MPGRRKLRLVRGLSLVNVFVPDRPGPRAGREVVLLCVEELEAIRLKDFPGLDQEVAAKVMNIISSDLWENSRGGQGDRCRSDCQGQNA